jgi:hypothetical protein
VATVVTQQPIVVAYTGMYEDDFNGLEDFDDEVNVSVMSDEQWALLA